ncbi:ABC transporter permease [Bacillus sp. AK128]
MLSRLLAAEFLKVKRKWAWFLIFLGPFGVIALQAVNFGVRYDYLTNQYKDDLWGGLLNNVQAFTPAVLIMGMAIITSIVAQTDHENRSWKHLLSLPINKYTLLLAKFFLSVLMLGVSSILLAIGTVILGIALKFGVNTVPFIEIVKIAFYPYLAALPILAVQLWIAVIYSHQGVAITVGILGAMFSTYSFKMPDWVIWKWPSLMNQWETPIYSVYFGIMTAIVIFLVSSLHFNIRDVEE